MKLAYLLGFMLACAAPAAEPRYQLRSLIQNDGTLLHVRLDTETGKTWRLERLLQNRFETALRGKLAARELQRTQVNLPALRGWTLGEVVKSLNTQMAKLDNPILPKIQFAVPVKEPDADPDQAKERLVPPTDPQQAFPRNVPPPTDLPVVPLPGVQIDPATGLPFRPGLPGRPPHGVPGVAIDPLTGRPILPRAPERQPLWQPPHRKDQADLYRIRAWAQPTKDTSLQLVLTQLLNMVDSPLRCVVDEKGIYLTPESSVIAVSGGGVSTPRYVERWVEITEPKPE